jgi:hypothetical protein
LTTPETGGGVVVGEEELEQPVSDPATKRHATGNALKAMQGLPGNSLWSLMGIPPFRGAEAPVTE